jgi:hypothetical protein
MVVLPAPTTVTVPLLDTVATAVLLLLYVKAPLLSLVGAIRLKEASPKFLAGAVNVPIVGAIGETTRDAETVDPPV